MKSARALKKSSYHEEPESETWAISYGDMITLLLSFFVIYFTTDFKKEKVNTLNRHLSFSLEGSLEAPPQVFTSQQPADKVLDPASQFKSDSVDVPELSMANVKAETIGEMVVISFGPTSFFDTASTSVHQRGIEVLNLFTKKYLPFAGNYRLSIKGFTDKRPVLNKSLKFEDNLELSALRSIAAMRILQKAGIPLNRMDIAGVGEMQAIETIVANSKNLSAKEINAFSRTIVIVIKPEKESWL